MKPPKPKLDPAMLKPTSGRQRMTIHYPVKIIRQPGSAESRATSVEQQLIRRRYEPGSLGPTQSSDETDDDPWDEQTQALIVALNELAGDSTRGWDPAKHPRNPSGSPGGGRFRSMVDRLKDAIEEHVKGKGKGHPLDGFDRPQLVRAAKARGIDYKGISREVLAEKLLDDLGKGHTTPPEAVYHYQPGKDITGTPAIGNIAKALDRPSFDQDLALAEIQARQGFNGPPQVVSRAEFDRAVAAGEVTETFRGLNGPSASLHAEAYRTGDNFPGTGVYGNGTYVANDLAQAELCAGRYEPGSTVGAVLRIGLRSDAKVITIDKLRAEMRRFEKRHAAQLAQVDELDRQMMRAAERAHTTEQRIAVYTEFNAKKAALLGPEYAVSRDAGRFAALRGYDAIDVPVAQGGAQMVILNRTAVIVEQA